MQSCHTARAEHQEPFFSNECITCKHPAYGVPLHATLMQPRGRNHMPTRMGPHSEAAPAGACRNVQHKGILRTRVCSQGIRNPVDLARRANRTRICSAQSVVATSNHRRFQANGAEGQDGFK